MALLGLNDRYFEHTSKPYTEGLAFLEAERCIQCKKPTCIDGCPVR